jgi:hypothetical protein
MSGRRSRLFDARNGSQQRHERPMTDAGALLPAHLVGQPEINTLQNANLVVRQGALEGRLFSVRSCRLALSDSI